MQKTVLAYFVCFGLTISSFAFSSAPSQDTKSVYLVASEDFPLGEVLAARLLSKIIDLGARDLTIEVPLLLKGVHANRVYFPIRKVIGSPSGVKTFIAMARNSGLKITLKPVFKDRGSKYLYPIMPNDREQFLDSLGLALQAVAKIANESGVESFVFGTGLEKFLCENSTRMNRMFALVKRYYSREVRIDFANAKSLKEYYQCVQYYYPKMPKWVDLREFFPSATFVKTLNQNGIGISFLSFNSIDDNLEERAREFFLSLINFEEMLTVGTFYTDVNKAGPHSGTDSIMETELMYEVEKWLQLEQ